MQSPLPSPKIQLVPPPLSSQIFFLQSDGVSLLCDQTPLNPSLVGVPLRKLASRNAVPPSKGNYTQFGGKTNLFKTLLFFCDRAHRPPRHELSQPFNASIFSPALDPPPFPVQVFFYRGLEYFFFLPLSSLLACTPRGDSLGLRRLNHRPSMQTNALTSINSAISHHKAPPLSIERPF